MVGINGGGTSGKLQNEFSEDFIVSRIRFQQIVERVTSNAFNAASCVFAMAEGAKKCHQKKIDLLNDQEYLPNPIP